MLGTADGNSHRVARPSPCPSAIAYTVEILMAGTAKIVDAGNVYVLLKIGITIGLHRGGVAVDFLFQVAKIAVVVGVVAAQTVKRAQGATTWRGYPQGPVTVFNIVSRAIGEKGGRKGPSGQIFSAVDNMRRIMARNIQIGIMAGATELASGLHQILGGIRGRLIGGLYMAGRTKHLIVLAPCV